MHLIIADEEQTMAIPQAQWTWYRHFGEASGMQAWKTAKSPVDRQVIAVGDGFPTGP